MSSIWTDESPDDFRDVPDDVTESADLAQVAIMQEEAMQKKIEYAKKRAKKHDDVEEVANDQTNDNSEDEEEDYSEVMADARLRLEQGRLYEMIMNHELFNGLDSDPNAVKYVQREIRKFAKERMEVMLGMRKETSIVEKLEIDFPFNQLEVDILRKLAKTATKGASENSDRFVPEVRRTTEELDVVPRKQGLNQIGGVAKSRQQMTSLKPQNKPMENNSTPLQRKKAEAPIKGDVKKDEYKPLKKPVHEMTEQELIDRNKETAKRQTRKVARTTVVTPMPTLDQQIALHTSRMLSDGKTADTVAGIMAIINNQKNNNPIED